MYRVTDSQLTSISVAGLGCKSQDQSLFYRIKLLLYSHVAFAQQTSDTCIKHFQICYVHVHVQHYLYLTRLNVQSPSTLLTNFQLGLASLKMLLFYSACPKFQRHSIAHKYFKETFLLTRAANYNSFFAGYNIQSFYC